MKNWNGKYWRISPKRQDEYAYIYCPEMNKHLSFGVKRAILKEMVEFELFLKQHKRGWVACTDIKHPHIMRLFAKWGARPFNLVLEEDNLYFIKELT